LTVQYVGQTVKIRLPFQQVGPQDVQTAEQQSISINLAQYYLVLTKGRWCSDGGKVNTDLARVYSVGLYNRCLDAGFW